MLNRMIIATAAVALLLGLRASATEISWSEQRDLDYGRIEAWIEDGWLHARRVDSSDDLVWHVVLGQVDKGAVPTIAPPQRPLLRADCPQPRHRPH